MPRKPKVNVFDDVITMERIPQGISSHEAIDDMDNLLSFPTTGNVQTNSSTNKTVTQEEQIEDLDIEDEELEKEMIIEDIQAIQVNFHVNVFPMEKLLGSSLKNLKAKRKLLLKKISVGQESQLEALILNGGLKGFELLASAFGINMYSPYSLSETVSNNPKVNLILKQIGLSSKMSDTIQNPYAQIALITSLSAVDIAFRNKLESPAMTNKAKIDKTVTINAQNEPIKQATNEPYKHDEKNKVEVKKQPEEEDEEIVITYAV